ncbi:sugar nucleotide-binding protein [Oceanospirillaceae bacterium]|nr:sugar nucleotide-binding protein [Oceanospirillaceae bacterium]
MRIIITGATSYIGKRVAKVAVSQGFDVVSMSRRQSEFQTSSWIPYDLTATSVSNLPPKTLALIHLAANTVTAHNTDSMMELRSVRLLLSATKKIGAKFIFVSSQTARADAPTSYGLTKWAIEKEVLAVGGFVVRPGLVYGGIERGLFGTLVKVTRRLPLLPAFLPAPKIQPIHVDDLAEGLLSIVKNNIIKSSVLCLASPIPIKFSKFMLAIAKVRVRRCRLLVPVPVLFIHLIGSMIGKQWGSLLGIAQLKSLFYLPLVNTNSDLKQLNLNLRPLLSGLHPSGNDRRRRLISEGSALLCYVLKVRPDSDLLRRYVRAVEKLRGGSPLVLPSWVAKWPITVGLFDSQSLILTARKKEFFWRLNTATALAEATPVGAHRFLGLGPNRGHIISLTYLFRAVFTEIIWRILKRACSPLLRCYMQDERNLK